MEGPLAEFTLKTSYDFGVTYVPHEFALDQFSLVRSANNLADNCRWVIVDAQDNVLNYCQYHAANLKVKGADTIATDDPYMKKLAQSHGLKVMTSDEMIARLGLPKGNPTENLSKKEVYKLALSAR